MSGRSATAKMLFYSALLTAGLMIFIATRVNGHVKDWRDGLPGTQVAVVTGPTSNEPQARTRDAAIAADQRQLAADVGAPGADSHSIVRDTTALIADVNGPSVPSARRERELRSALSLVRSHGCASCTTLLSAALVP